MIDLIKRISVNLPQNALLTMYKSFFRHHLDYGDLLYNKPNNENSQNEIEKVQYRACLAKQGAMQLTGK